MAPVSVSKINWFQTNILDLDGDLKMKEEYVNGLSKFKWLESFQIIDTHEIHKHQLEIVLNFDQLPRTEDIVELFGEKILPFITYKEFPKTEWFERKLLDENFKMKEKYKNELLRLPWVKDFYIGFDKIKDKTWKIYMTLDKLSMVELEKIFGVNIYCFLDFKQKQDIGNDAASDFHRRPESKLEIHKSNDTRASISGVVVDDTGKHYAVTCYHACFKGELPEDGLARHEKLKEDYKNGSTGCSNFTYVYADGDESRRLGTFHSGLYDDEHDIALIEIDRYDQDTVTLLGVKSIERTLASDEEVVTYFKKNGGEIRVGKIGLKTGKTDGKLFAIDGTVFSGTGDNNYLIRANTELFASYGDAGSLVYMICEDGKKIPFAYLCGRWKDLYCCKNLNSSLEALNRSIEPYLVNCGVDDKLELVKSVEEASECHLENVCKAGNKPTNIAAAKDVYGKENLPSIANEELARTRWFERSILDGDSKMKEKFAIELSSFGWVESFEIIVADEKRETHILEIVCRFGKVPLIEDTTQLFGEEILPFISYREFPRAEWFQINILDGDFKMKKKFANELSRLKWVESFEIIAANKRCQKHNLEIVCRSGKAPSNKDIVKLFSEEILPFITYKKFPKNPWFEKNIFDEAFMMKKIYVNGLVSLSWVRNFYIGFDGQKDKTWKLYITFTQNQQPSMDEVKEIFGVNIYCFVEFIKKPIPDGSKSGFHRGPRSGDPLHVISETGGSGTIGIIGVGNNYTHNHYAVTCYHVCFNEDTKTLFGAHKRMKDAYNENPKECVGATYEYTDERNRRGLGTFSCGLYSDKHDIALVKLDDARCLNCKDAVTFLKKKDVEIHLASRREVFENFRKMEGSVLVEKFGSVSKHREGELFSIYEGPWKNGMNEGFYRIRNYLGQKVFSVPGDSGSLVCMICEDGRKVPFAYMSNTDGIDHYCPNLKDSLQALNPDIRPCLGECGFNNT